MRRIHYSAEPLTGVRSVSQNDQDRRLNRKPAGLWYSIGREWQDWCEAEQFGLGRLAHRARLDVDLSRILVLDTEAAVREFSQKYGCEFFPGLEDSIDWPAVARLHAGIEINPYQWACRFSLMWYYGWDCASGCVWDATAVRIAGPVRQRKATA